ncbi:aldehyde dehydrogenase [Pseudonocardia xishanensis]|uniref:Aldehyde dehydrogenase n=1 Tax=Pseudonocardia xishanensis TaxID=630995 RepID=A0ABP8RYF7_9PSEU
MPARTDATQLLHAPDRIFVDGSWAVPSAAAHFEVVDSATEEICYSVAAASASDVDRAVTAASRAFEDGPWPRLSPAERAGHLRVIADEIEQRIPEFAEIWPRQSGILHRSATASTGLIPGVFRAHAELAGSFGFIERPAGRLQPDSVLVREPVGVVGAIIPWNAPLFLIAHKLAPALLAGCTVVLKAAPEAPGEAYLFAEVAEAAGLPPGVVNVLAADRDVSERLVRDPRVDKISFTGSTAAGRRIAGVMSERIGRVTLELGGKSAAVVLDDFDPAEAARSLAATGCSITGQVCASITRVIVSRARHDEFVEAMADAYRAITVGDPFAAESDMGPLAMSRQRDRVEGLIADGVAGGARLVTGGRRPPGLDRGFFIEPTLFAHVDNSSTIAQEEIFGPVMSVIPVDRDSDAVRVANDSIYGLNSAVFTHDLRRAAEIARRLRAGTVGHNGFRTDFGVAFGGFKQSGLGREGGREGLLPYLETKTVVPDPRDPALSSYLGGATS